MSHCEAACGRSTALWLAFNAIYGGEVDTRERTRIRAAVRRHISESTARAILGRTDIPANRILTIPPGNMSLEDWNPSFRRASRELARIYRNRSESAVNRLAALAGTLYQVRCNLLHGRKDPRLDRDRMLVQESVRVLELLVPEIERGAS